MDLQLKQPNVARSKVYRCCSLFISCFYIMKKALQAREDAKTACYLFPKLTRNIEENPLQ